MARIFDIRFARTSGLAALFEAPANSFRWKGPGRLSIDDQWLVFARRPIFSWPFARLRRRMPVAALSSVYREGNSLRLEFAGSPQLVVPIWARDPADAAEIVRLVPTDRTVEVDGADSKPESASRRGRGLALVALGVVIGIVATLAIVNGRRDAAAMPEAPTAGASAVASPTASASPSRAAVEAGSAAPGSARTSASSAGPQTSASASSSSPGGDAASSPAAAPDVASDAQPEYPGAAGSAVPVVVEEPSVAIAPPRSDFFRREALELQSEYLQDRTLGTGLADRWWALSQRLYNSPEFNDWRLRPMVDAQLGVSLNWRASLANYDVALRSGSRARIEAARADLEAANELTDRVLGFAW